MTFPPSLTGLFLVKLKGFSERLDQSNDRGITLLRMTTAFIACLIPLLFIVRSSVLRGAACVVARAAGPGFTWPGSRPNVTAY